MYIPDAQILLLHVAIVYWPVVLVTIYAIFRAESVVDGLGLMALGVIVTAAWMYVLPLMMAVIIPVLEFSVQLIGVLAAIFAVGFLIRFYLRAPKY